MTSNRECFLPHLILVVVLLSPDGDEWTKKQTKKSMNIFRHVEYSIIMIYVSQNNVMPS